jgi:hypothetical protein
MAKLANCRPKCAQASHRPELFVRVPSDPEDMQKYICTTETTAGQWGRWALSVRGRRTLFRRVSAAWSGRGGGGNQAVKLAASGTRRCANAEDRGAAAGASIPSGRQRV